MGNKAVNWSIIGKSGPVSLGVVLVIALGQHVYASTVAVVAESGTRWQSPNPFSGLDYAPGKELFQQRLMEATGYEAKATVAREYVTAGRHAGQPRLERMFKNFGDAYRVNFDDAGVVKQITLLRSLAKNQVAGASRELVYYQKVYNNPMLFQDVRIGQPVPTEHGGTSDMDLRYRSGLTGRDTWVEVKNVRHLQLDARLRAQLQRMGEFPGRKVLVTRGNASPQVREFARQHNVEVLEGVKSENLASALSRSEIQAMKASGAAGVGFGVVASGFGGYRLFSRLSEANWEMNDAVWRGSAADTLLIGAGVTTTTKGVITLLQARAAADAAAATGAVSAPLPYAKAAKVLGPVGWGLMVAYVGAEGYRTYKGDVNPREGVATVSGLTGALGGAIGGGKLGAMVGAPGGPVSSAVCAIVFGVGGGVGGFFTARAASDLVYDRFVFSSEELAARKVSALADSLK